MTVVTNPARPELVTQEELEVLVLLACSLGNLPMEGAGFL